ncbi:iron-containing alcohol dehydrogenase [Paenibacillus sp. J5C_2022]|uniref:iron-containing alcohol dehydrogenase n=1 Tax=Paenibacillus sp. J5C2022 TaxID=2977129 RepID=UPI0021D3D148|nr:iron-containing alcohol dehydrogenase [Paenibacillus sp. J5C2022]MCU6712906.1 iron-containing alcohol dehydrogenase [Paenibacillus sp. J5C2022]
MDYRFQTASSVVGGSHSIRRLNELMAALHSPSHVLILTQPSMIRLGHIDTMTRQLDTMRIAWHVHDRVMREPTLDSIYDICDEYSGHSFDALIGMGGGSVLDATKLLATLLVERIPPARLLQSGAVCRRGLPMALIPTTSGTGSEVTPNAIVTLPEEELKVGIISPFFYPDIAILDPVLTLDLPQSITAATGMDAFTHALESYISNKANPISDMFALEAIRLISSSLLPAYHHARSLEDRERVLLGSAYAGMALSAAGTAAVHALAYPLGGSFNVPHGVANSMLLTHVMNFNLDAIEDRLIPVAAAMGYHERGGDTQSPAAWVLEQITHWTKEMEIPQSLTPFGAKPADLERLTAAAAKVTRLLNNNPKPLHTSDIAAIYNKLMPLT